MKKIITLTLVGVLALSALVYFAVSSENFSNGARAGYVQKFSKKGNFFKTWEGEMNLAIGNSVAPQIWNFSCESDSVASQITSLVGEKVELTYHETKWKNWGHLRGETDYFVTSVRQVK